MHISVLGFGIFLGVEGFLCIYIDTYIYLSGKEFMVYIYTYIYIYMNGPETNVELYRISAAGTPGKAASK